MNQVPQILRFTPLYRKVRWGGQRLTAYKRLSQPLPQGTGESWELSGLPDNETIVGSGPLEGLKLSQVLHRHGPEVMGERLYKKYGDFFPVLVKFIDADDDLSIQVHPGDGNPRGDLGKTELWYIIDSRRGSYLYSGFNRVMDEEALCQAMQQNRLVDMLAKHFPKPGDVFYLPAGRIHSIGAGNLILEIQQTSGTTYRLWDYNRRDDNGTPRPLHIQEAMDVIDYGQTDYGLAHPQLLIGYETRIKTTPYFKVNGVQIMKDYRMDIARHDSPRIITAVEGSGILTTPGGESATITRGETLLVTARTNHVDIVATDTPLKLVSVTLE